MHLCGGFVTLSGAKSLVSLGDKTVFLRCAQNDKDVAGDEILRCAQNDKGAAGDEILRCAQNDRDAVERY
jgi:hypothetical protein